MLVHFSGQEEYARLRALCYPSSSVILCCFAINDPDSFSEIEQKWLPEAKHFCPQTPVILVGTKCDLRQENEDGSAPANEIAYDEVGFKSFSLLKFGLDSCLFLLFKAIELYNRLGMAGYIECSARTHTNVRQLFEYAIRQSLLEVASPSSGASSAAPKKAKKRVCTIL
jgi:Ras family protein A